MSRIKKKSVAHVPLRIIRIEIQEFGKKNMDEIGATHGTTRVSGLGFFYHSCRKNPDVIGGSCVDVAGHLEDGILDTVVLPKIFNNPFLSPKNKRVYSQGINNEMLDKPKLEKNKLFQVQEKKL